MGILDSWKLPAFYLLLWGYRAARGIEPLRSLLLTPMKRANAWMAVRDRRNGRYKIRNYPSHVTIQATWRCNLKCPMCFRQHWPEGMVEEMNRNLMSLEDFRRVADELLPYALTVNLSVAGEPLLVPYLDEVLDIISRHRCKLEIFTNITPLTSDALMDKVLPHVGIMRASMDGATKQTFEKIRKGARFEKCVAALERFGRRRTEMEDPKPAFGFWVVVQKDNVHELPELVRLAHRVGADFVSGDHLVVFDDRTRAMSVAQDAVYGEFYEKARQAACEFGVSISDLRPPAPPPAGTSSPDQADRAKQRLECPYLWSRAFVDYNGKLLACCHPRPPEFGDDVFEKGFWGVWDSVIARRIRRYYLTDKAYPSCKGCYMLVEIPDQE